MDSENLKRTAVIWENKYANNQDVNIYPWDHIVAWTKINLAKGLISPDAKILEVGCGTGNNLWFAAREGFEVFGIDISETAIDFAKKRFSAENLTGHFECASMTELPFTSDSFDIVLDRAAICCLDQDAAVKCFSEVSRVLIPGGLFYFNPYSDQHSSLVSGLEMVNDLVTGIHNGGLSGAKLIRFYSRKDIEVIGKIFGTILSVDHVTKTNMLNYLFDIEAEWRVTYKKRLDV